jgi:hypothetical protein
MVCGSEGCVQEEVDGGCSLFCGDNNHYECDLKHVCVEKACSDRVFLSEKDPIPCGTAEYYPIKNSSTEYECKTKCLSR